MPGTPPAAPGPYRRRPADERAARVRFRRAVALMLMTLVLPGSAQLVAGNRDVGRIAMRVWFGLVLGAVLTLAAVLIWPVFAFWLVSSTTVLALVRFGLIALALGWAALFVDAWRIGQPLTLSFAHRRAVVGVNGVLCLSVAGALLFGSHLTGVYRDSLVTVFGDGEAVAAADGRYNVALFGGDAGAGRFGLRPDSITVASIDAESGRTVLISLPRNLARFPFREGSVMAREFPDGFDCEGCYLNGVSTWATDRPELFRGSETPGIDATLMAVEGITDLDINYWAMVDLRGFRQLVDAVGGVTLTVRDRIPVGLPHESYFRYIEPGRQQLDGLETLWFARARYGSDDYSRMARQKCVMNAMLHQVSPQVALRNFERIARAGSQMVSTSIPTSEVGRFLDLALKAKSQRVSTVSLVPPRINTGDPDVAEIHAMIDQALDRASGEAAPPEKKPRKRRASTSTTGGSIGSLAEGYAANEAEDLGAAC
ncbi:LCP family protein [Nocardioides coralli]|uniref:LCP family protein n=1 Tax=Nocardioides coralli TaxID=2872154 RepID=UPI001CA3FD77|nr:LCP family protein [Nocardioides coralli]QZY30004.1 LCP family protein [Nocardioides coralli]